MGAEMSDPFLIVPFSIVEFDTFPEQAILTLFKDLESFCAEKSCKGDIEKAACRTRVLAALRQQVKPLWAAIVDRKLSGNGGQHSVPLDHEKTSSCGLEVTNLDWLKPTHHDWLVLDFRLMLRLMFFYLVETVESQPASSVSNIRKRGRPQADPMISRLQNDIADYFLAWLDTPLHARAATMRGQILGRTKAEKGGAWKTRKRAITISEDDKPHYREETVFVDRKASVMVSRSQDHLRQRLAEKPKRRQEEGRPKRVSKDTRSLPKQRA
jgi:hypothetical protein